MKFKVTRGTMNKWFVFRKYHINGSDEFRWVEESPPCDTREEAIEHLPEEANAIDTIIMST